MKETKFWEKNFMFIFTLIITASVFAFDILLAFHTVPPENKSIVDFIAGALNSGALLTVIGYWYSSTASSKEKTKQVTDLINGNIEKKQPDKIIE